MSQMNLTGARALFMREVRRFLKVNMQTIVTPALTAMLYLVIFRYAMGDRHVPGMEVDYFTFLVPGLAMMAMMQNAFANTSSSMIMGKVMGMQIYLLMAPLSAFEVVAAFLLAAVVRAVVVAAAFLVVLLPFVDFSMPHPGIALVYGICASLMMGGMGLIGGMWARDFDQVAMVTNFVILPLTFLSGVFYSVQQLPPFWQAINNANPFFYLTDGFRYGFLGVGDTDPFASMGVVLVSVVVTCLACWQLWRSGWRMKE
ncbi:metal-dependent hydrolase [Mariprofundus erugo]|uniref:Transport permease protein n=1 Tax=Mariprofundus erugo TaxID=2528639 RepID=A0A5R9GI63_9PROT|nr:ABC transporter permease [Mariprofundus erugo]TLS66000.1 metal-dependent hydrolase [Mariprofundus erugo]TLS76343.1 metal-dependent hydrolase [Mariprofundus erugo]